MSCKRNWCESCQSVPGKKWKCLKYFKFLSSASFTLRTGSECGVRTANLFFFSLQGNLVIGWADFTELWVRLYICADTGENKLMLLSLEV